ncbi:unnamed protein product [Darwinula stevensoni]|uniref:MICOS complex subunit n=1 Tax=Darwinula stevensoni TaxID=69355 RepID=A0A7R8XB89_9CRUS|nr:unnamed protein product [Darwinula stevensoni]CAG0892602.1 unnamed protein product [Darwinula stevensoni]
MAWRGKGIAHSMGLVSGSIGLVIPTLKAASNNEDDPKTVSQGSKKIRPKDLPIYGRDDIQYEYYVDPPTSLEKAVGNVREQVGPYVNEAVNGAEKYAVAIAGTSAQIIQAGRHYGEALEAFIGDEKNDVPKIGAIAMGGLLGLLLARRRGLFRKTLYMSVALGAVVLYFHCNKKNSGGKNLDGVKTASKRDSTGQVTGDFGQSNPQDQDMYSTRSS